MFEWGNFRLCSFVSVFSSVRVLRINFDLFNALKAATFPAVNSIFSLLFDALR
jgi:hypothetical protein